MLTLVAYMYSHDGLHLNSNRKAFAFEVRGLPEADQAWIANMKSRWKVLRAKSGVYGKWLGAYKSADAALSAVRGER
jgi:hypothetical protein